MRLHALRLLALLALALFATHSLADVWNVARLRGEVLQLVDGDWQPLLRKGSIPDDRAVRTGPNGHVALVRGKETIELGPNTQIQIFDKGGRRPFTTVEQAFGTVTIDAEARNVQHFAVRTQMMAAVVKGTRFTVLSEKGQASVEVKRGHVFVEDRIQHSTTLIAAGQRAAVEKGATMSVSGRGTLPPVLGKNGKPVKSDKSNDKTAVEQAIAALKAAQASGDPKAIEKAEKNLAKIAGKATKAAEKAAEEARRGVEKAVKDAEKTAKSDADESGKGGSADAGKSGDGSGKGGKG